MVTGFGRGVVRHLAFGLTFAVLGAVPGEAQTVPPCKTTAGEDGLVFEGTYALIHAPVAFDTVTSDAPEIGIVPELESGLTVLALVGKASADSVVVEFLADEAVVHQCAVTVVAFDPTIHYLARLEAGDCNLQLVAGNPQLVASHAQVLEAPREFWQLANTAEEVAKVSTLSARRLYMWGEAPGLTVLVWLEKDDLGSFAINICPMSVVSSTDGFGAKGPRD